MNAVVSKETAAVGQDEEKGDACWSRESVAGALGVGDGGGWSGRMDLRIRSERGKGVGSRRE